jgi:hypothetical protein
MMWEAQIGLILSLGNFVQWKKGSSEPFLVTVTDG